MAVRILTAAVGLPVLIALVIIGGLPLRIGIGAVSLIGMGELYKALDGKLSVIHVFGFMLYIYLLMFINEELHSYTYYLTLALLCMVMTFSLIIIWHKEYSINTGYNIVFGLVYVGLTLLCIDFIRIGHGGLLFTCEVFVVAFASDTGAYFVGRAFGKHKLIPDISPNKTVEGAIGGVIFSAIFAALFAYAFARIRGYYRPVVFCRVAFVAGIVGSIVGQFGDLTASAIKRSVGIKDFGRLFPGHGGVLDRFDSVIFIAPYILYLKYQILTYVSVNNYYNF